jgi:hypothetical protein
MKKPMDKKPSEDKEKMEKKTPFPAKKTKKEKK